MLVQQLAVNLLQVTCGIAVTPFGDLDHLAEELWFDELQRVFRFHVCQRSRALQQNALHNRQRGFVHRNIAVDQQLLCQRNRGVAACHIGEQHLDELGVVLAPARNMTGGVKTLQAFFGKRALNAGVNINGVAGEVVWRDLQQRPLNVQRHCFVRNRELQTLVKVESPIRPVVKNKLNILLVHEGRLVHVRDYSQGGAGRNCRFEGCNSQHESLLVSLRL